MDARLAELSVGAAKAHALRAWVPGATRGSGWAFASREQNLAALDLMRLRWGGLELQAGGAWDRLAQQVRDHDGTSIISHEIFATASRTQVQRALASLGHEAGGGGTEVHLVISVRDLVRQIPAEWQENVKHRARFSYAKFLEIIADPQRSHRVGAWFWGVQEIPDILARWGATIPAERVHLVTVPPPGSPRDELWRRFSEAFGLDGLHLDLTPEQKAVGKANFEQAAGDLAGQHRVEGTVEVDDPALEAGGAGAVTVARRRSVVDVLGATRKPDIPDAFELPPEAHPVAGELVPRHRVYVEALGLVEEARLRAREVGAGRR
mgnify:CR=1 FL=1